MTSQPARKTPGELLREKGQLADDVVAVRIGATVVDLHTPVPVDSVLTPVRASEPEGLRVLRHSAAHVMADAVQRLLAVLRRAGTHAARAVWAPALRSSVARCSAFGHETYIENSRTASTTRAGSSCATQCPAPSKTSVLTRGISDTARDAISL